ncbi:ParB/RepB/Spo0J family partition protein [Hyphomicrobium nitrativorans]|uniref:ParB/RepB/Spo0J family partition protein n=1 Tax=Hyphomicrobium nitrativorans TaxID=1427356 RepID=UPI000684C852|nr:ParB/RepB/Spo0J family partition protein [Hyphomicrobium nitrativorans]
MTEITYFPLTKLVLWDGNVRKTDIHAGIDELAASIAAHGLLQSLVVRPGKRGKFDIVAGQRRLLALQALVKAGKIDKAYMVPCLLADAQLAATELSLAENAVRAHMHPADQFEAFRQLIDGGSSVADIAARFGVSDTVVARRMKLGRLSPVILDAYRSGVIDLEEAQAFAISDDQAAQERVFSELSEWSRNAHNIRGLLTEGDVSTSDKRVRFVGLDTYVAAGGALRQDLFDDAGSGFILDLALLERLVAEKFNACSADIRAEGWSWVEIIPDADWQTISRFKRVRAERAPLSEADQAELERLAGEYDDLADTENADEDRLAVLQERMDALEDTPQSWTSEALAVAGAILCLDHRGALCVERGLVRKEDADKLQSDEASSAGDEPCSIARTDAFPRGWSRI